MLTVVDELGDSASLCRVFALCTRWGFLSVTAMFQQLFESYPVRIKKKPFAIGNDVMFTGIISALLHTP